MRESRPSALAVILALAAVMAAVLLFFANLPAAAAEVPLTYTLHDWYPTPAPVSLQGRMASAGTSTLPELTIAQTRVLSGPARRPTGSNYLQGVRLAGATLWGNAGKCCAPPPIGVNGESLYRYPLTGTRWEWVAGGNSTAVDANAIPIGDAPELDEWEAGSPRPVTIGPDTLVVYLATRWSAHLTGEPRAQVGVVRLSGATITHGLWIPKADAKSQIAPWGLSTDPAGTWLYTTEMGPAGTSAERRKVDVATAALGSPERVYFADGANHNINDHVYSPVTGSWWGLESEQPCDYCSRERCGALTVWESKAVTFPTRIPAGVMWEKVATISGPGGWSIFEGHWSRDAAGQRLEPWSLTASLAPPGLYADSGTWEVAFLQSPGASLPAALSALLGPVPAVPIVTPTPTPTPGPTATPTPAAVQPSEGIFYPPAWVLVIPRTTSGAVAPHLAGYQCGTLGCSIVVDGVLTSRPPRSGGEIVARREAIVACTGCVRLWGTSGGVALEPVIVPAWGTE